MLDHATQCESIIADHVPIFLARFGAALGTAAAKTWRFLRWVARRNSISRQGRHLGRGAERPEF